MASASRSRSHPTSFVAPRSSSARACPPSPTVQSAKRPPRSGARSSIASLTMTGSWTGVLLMTSNAELGKRARVVVGVRLTLQLRDEALVVPDVEVLVLSEHVDVADHPGRVPQPRVNEHAALRI